MRSQTSSPRPKQMRPRRHNESVDPHACLQHRKSGLVGSPRPASPLAVARGLAAWLPQPTLARARARAQRPPSPATHTHFFIHTRRHQHAGGGIHSLLHVLHVLLLLPPERVVHRGSKFNFYSLLQLLEQNFSILEGREKRGWSRKKKRGSPHGPVSASAVRLV